MILSWIFFLFYVPTLPKSLNDTELIFSDFKQLLYLISEHFKYVKKDI